MSTDGACVNRLARTIYKNLTLMLFLVLPVKVTKVFLELSIALLITNVRGEKAVERCFNMDKFNRLLNTTYDKDILALPSYTLSWFWSERSLNSIVHLREGEFTLREALRDDQLLRHNLGTVANEIMARLPFLIKFKLHLADKRARLHMRHNLVSLFNQGLVHV